MNYKSFQHSAALERGDFSIHSYYNIYEAGDETKL